ncbi:MAG: hypothetical protein M9962_07815 [Oligoflexia bacterium]|nr:hypothetical protein [Oligoflexia bacterium]
MTFTDSILNKIQNTPIYLDADSIRLHKIHGELWELTIDGQPMLFSYDAGEALATKLTCFLKKLRESKDVQI